MRTAKRRAVINEGPDHRSRRHQPEEYRAEAERDQAEHGDEHASHDHGNRQHDKVDQESKHPSNQYAAKQFGPRPGVKGMRLKIARAAAAPGATRVAGTAVRHGSVLSAVRYRAGYGSGCLRLQEEPQSLRANGSRERAPDDRLREAIH